MSTEINQQTFKEFIASGVCLIDFWAPWCGPCRMQLPVLEQVAAQLPDVKIGKVNVDESPELAAEYGVNNIPYLVVFKDGVKKADFIGLRQAPALQQALADADA